MMLLLVVFALNKASFKFFFYVAFHLFKDEETSSSATSSHLREGLSTRFCVVK